MIRPGRPGRIGDQYGFGAGRVRLCPALPTAPVERWGAWRGAAVLGDELIADGLGGSLRGVARATPWMFALALLIPAVVDRLRFRPDESDIRIVAFEPPPLPVAPETPPVQVAAQPETPPKPRHSTTRPEPPKPRVERRAEAEPPRRVAKVLPPAPAAAPPPSPAPVPRRSRPRTRAPEPARTPRPALRIASLEPLPSAPAAPPVARTTAPRRNTNARASGVPRVRIDPLAAAAPEPPAAPPASARRDSFRVARSSPKRAARPVAGLAPVPAAPAPAPATPGRSGRATAPQRGAAPARGRTRARSLFLPSLRAPDPGSAVPAPARTAQRTRSAGGGAPASPHRERRVALSGVPLASLASCLSDREEDRLKQRIVAIARDDTVCTSRLGRYRFVQTRNLNAFLMWIERAPDRAAADRCVELRHALDCLRERGAKEA